MSNALGMLTKCAFRIAPTNGIDINNANFIYPTSVANATTYVHPVLGNHDQVPLLSEGLDDSEDYEVDETLDSSPAIADAELVSKLPSGSLTLSGKYDGLDALIACATGFEKPDEDDSPSFPNETALTAGTCAAGTFVNSSGVFTSGDVGKFITITSGTGMHQIRRISEYNSTTSVDITPNWDVTPTAADTASMNQSFLHTFEMSKQLCVETFSDVYSGYDDGGVLTSTDKIARFGALGFQKQVTDWVYRACMVNKMDIELMANSALKLDFEILPFDLIKGSYHATDWDYNLSSNFPAINKRAFFKEATLYLKEYSTSVDFTASNKICANGFKLSLDNALKSDDQSFCSGVRRMEPSRGGFRTVTGTINLPRYDSDTLLGYKENQTTLMAKLVITGDEIETSYDWEITIWIPTLKLLKGNPNVSGSAALTLSFDFQAYVPAGAAKNFPTQWDTTNRGELIIQTQNMNPFNAFLNQNKEY